MLSLYCFDVASLFIVLYYGKCILCDEIVQKECKPNGSLVVWLLLSTMVVQDQVKFLITLADTACTIARLTGFHFPKQLIECP